MSNRDDMIQLAIADLESGVFTSQRQADAKHQVPRSTLASRLAGSSAAREFIVDWILEEDARGYSPTQARTREMAS
ncbi:hypothetical protein K432DRAFT_312323 [Lepidopterella palustris CBS 459.81]|uniref:HTH psq-type domain-containing protein n=1 Tax=Lepidopterella palustris CBS 459.81 TaxID=1314670 RepID=A0A8E2J9E9_9PEZI|nr:hypothetical protein K432DRAFT_312323 [Lepidopterella palustris CBS 459.81]